MNHTGLPIVVSLANMTSSFSCSITYNSKFKDFTVNYFHINLQGQGSQEEKLPCQPGPVIENRTYTLSCPVNLRLPDASATGTYYCVVRWPSYMVQGSGTFILVRGESSPGRFRVGRAAAVSGVREPTCRPWDVI